MKLDRKSKIALIILAALFIFLGAVGLITTAVVAVATDATKHAAFDSDSYDNEQIANLINSCNWEIFQAILYQRKSKQMIDILHSFSNIDRGRERDRAITAATEAHETALQTLGQSSHITQYANAYRCLAEWTLVNDDVRKHYEEWSKEILSNSKAGYDTLSNEDKHAFFFSTVCRARWLYHAERYEQSIDVFKVVVMPIAEKLDLNDPNRPALACALYHFGFALLDRGDFEQALKTFDRLKELMEKRHAQPKDLGNVYTAIALTKNKMLDYKGALEDIQRAITLDPKKHQNYQCRAKTYSGLKDYAKAIEDLSHAYQLCSTPLECSQILSSRAEAYYRNNQETLAMKDIEHARDFSSKTFNRYLANALFNMGKNNEILKEYERVLAADPDNARLYAERADWTHHFDPKIAAPDYDKAISLCEEAIKSSQGKPLDQKFKVDLEKLYSDRASCLKEMGQKEQSLKLYQEAIRKFPLEPNLLHSKIALLKELHRKVDIKADCKGLFDSYPNKIFPYRFRAEIYLVNRDYTNAINDYTSAIDRYRSMYLAQAKNFPAEEQNCYIGCYTRRASCYEAIKKDDLADKDNQMARELEKRFNIRGSETTQ